MRLSLYALFALVTALVWVALKVIDLLRWLVAGVISSSAQQRMAAGQYRQAVSLYRLARRLTLWLRRARGQAALGEGLAHLALWQPAAAEQALSLASVSHFKAAQSTDPDFAASVLGARSWCAAQAGAAPVAVQGGALGAGAAPEDVRRVWPELVQFVERKPAAAA